MSLTPAEVAYAKWPMGNDGFVAVRNIVGSLQIIADHNLEGRIVGQLEFSKGRTGVELADVLDSSGKPVYFSGK
ncbi:MAG: hypothetical protein Q7R56_01525 [Nanoarchaeota archaeon]|nr:hypothetical protein [Nanoarchaeota archaeon]